MGKVIVNSNDVSKGIKLKKGDTFRLIGTDSTKVLYDFLCDCGFDFRKEEYKNVRKQSGYIKNANERYAVWPMIHNNINDEENEKWKNEVFDNYIKETWKFRDENHVFNDKHYNRFLNDYYDAQRLRVVFVKMEKGLFVFKGVYKINQQRTVHNADDAVLYFEEVSNVYVNQK